MDPDTPFTPVLSELAPKVRCDSRLDCDDLPVIAATDKTASLVAPTCAFQLLVLSVLLKELIDLHSFRDLLSAELKADLGGGPAIPMKRRCVSIQGCEVRMYAAGACESVWL